MTEQLASQTAVTLLRRPRPAPYILLAVVDALAAAVALIFSSGCMTGLAIGEHPEWRKLIAQPADRGLSAELVRFPSTDGLTLSAWWITTSRDPRADVVLAHGQGGNRSHMLGRAAFLTEAGYNVLAMDLRAHGDSDGRYMTTGYKEADDVLAAIEYLGAAKHERPIVLFGYSYGAVAVLHAASRSNELAAVIADAPFLSHVDVMHRIVDVVRSDPDASLMNKLGVGFVRWPGVPWLWGVEFYFRTGVYLNNKKIDALDAVPKMKGVPILFLAGERDTIAPAFNVQRLHDAADSPRKRISVLSDATHSTYTKTTKPFYERAVLDFLDELFLRPSMDPEPAD
jgi:pimeloyl-ACP methyl ester carboxylesterase